MSPARRFSLKAKAILVGLLAGLALVACAACAPGAVSGGFSVSDGSIEASGDELTVSLVCDPATGAAWSESLEGDGMEYDGVSHRSDEGNSEGDADVVAYDVFDFTGTGAGTQTVTFTLTNGDGSDAGKTVTVQTTTNSQGQITKASATGSDGSSGALS